MKFNTARKGFTLLELSIVLAIIGLIVGSILIGQDLIRIATIHAQVSQLEQYATAVNTFRGKYSTLPGDMPPNLAAQFGFTARSGLRGQGDNDGLLGSCIEVGEMSSATGSSQNSGCENVLFWSDLSASGLIGSNLTAATNGPAHVTSANWQQYYPVAKINSQTAIVVFGSSDEDAVPGALVWTPLQGNYFWIGQVLSTDALGNFSVTGTLTAMDAFAIDTKMDDGVPSSGRIMGGTNQFNIVGGAQAGLTLLSECPACCVQFIPSIYNTIAPYATIPTCQIISQF